MVNEIPPNDKILNAKDRRKAKRDAERLAKEKIENVESSLSNVVKQDAIGHDKDIIIGKPPLTTSKTPTVSNDKDNQLNAKERRKLKRNALQLNASESSGTSPQNENNMPVQKKKRRVRSKKSKNQDDNSEKSIHRTLFIGQLPFDCTKEILHSHFAEAGKIKVRMLTEKLTGKFRGMAFIELESEKGLGAALARHHTLIKGRRINVELTASGGGTNSEIRTKKINDLREKQKSKQLEKAKALVLKTIENSNGKLKNGDIDDRAIDFISWFDYETADNALQEFCRCMSHKVRNKKAFLMGILKRYRPTDGVEDRRK